MSGRPKTVREYMEDLKEGKEGKPDQVRDALDIYLELWAKVIEKGLVSEEDGIDVALSKLENLGGLYQAAEE